jgi:hypothetical protein
MDTGMEKEIINYILKSFNKMWLDDFELINNFPKYGNLPSIIWTNLLHFNLYLSKKFPKYGLEVHKGYGTRKHLKNIKKYGLSPVHRKTFVKA